MGNIVYNEEMVKNAKNFAFKLHENHKCVITGDEKKYHLEAVATKVKNLNLMNSNVSAIISYLHDSLDYTDDVSAKQDLLNNISNTCGSYIAQLVTEVSDNFKIEDISTEKGKYNYEKRKAQIKSPCGVSDEALIVILAEKVCNLTSMNTKIEISGKTYWKNLMDTYHLQKDDVKDYYESIYETLSDRCYSNFRLRDLLDDYDRLLGDIFYNK